MYIDSKETIWFRTYIEEKYEDEVLQMLKGGKTLEEVQNFIRYTQTEDLGEYLFDTCEELTPEHNEGQNTIELLDDNGNTVCGNVTGLNKKIV